MDKRLRLAILGSTGSVGRQVLDVVREQPEHLAIAALAARSNADLLERQVLEFQPRQACLTSASRWSADSLHTDYLCGDEALIDLATAPDVDLVVVATSGNKGFRPLLAAIQAGKEIALANKEALVMAGELVREAADAAGVQLRPVDSEHSALWQCLQGEPRAALSRLVLTASGGPFREWSREQLEAATPDQALRHPVWAMGRKITIDSATLMNKGLEIIEAHWLFNVPYDQLEVVIHPQGIVHSFAVFQDGSLKAQLGTPDMRTPIRYALSWPQRWQSSLPELDLLRTGSLHFFAPDVERFPCLAFARWAGKEGGTYPTALCASDEVAVSAFLEGRLSWSGISHLVRSVLDRHRNVAHPTLEDVLAADEEARRAAHELVKAMSHERAC